MMPPPNHHDRPLAALLVPDLLELLEEAPESIAPQTEEMHPADLADIAERCPRARGAHLLAALPKERAADVLEYLDEELRTEVLEAMRAREAAALVARDDAGRARRRARGARRGHAPTRSSRS